MEKPTINQFVSRRFIFKPFIFKQGLTALCLSLDLFFTAQAVAQGDQKLQGEMFLSLQYDDNASLQNDNEVEEYEAEIGLSLADGYQGSHLSYGYQVLFSVSEYHNNIFDRETDLVGVGNLDIKLIENRLLWQSTYLREELLQSYRSEDTPNNEDERGVLQTGPTLLFPFGRNTLSLKSTFVQVDNENIGDSKRYNHDASFSRILSPLTTVNLNAHYSDIYELENGLDFEIYRYQVGVVKIYKRGQLSISAGENEAKPQGGIDIRGFTYLATGTMEVASGSLALSATKALTDSSLGLSINSGFNANDFNNGDTDFAAADIVERQRAELRYSIPLPDKRGSAYLSFSRDKEDFKSVAQDTQENALESGINYQFSRTWGLGTTLSYRKIDYLEEAALDTEDLYQLILTSSYTFSDDFQMLFILGYQERDNRQASFRDYDNLRLGITFNYNFL